MGQKNNGKSADAFKFLFCVLFILLFSEAAFAQVSGLALNSRTDIRWEPARSGNNTVIGYYLYVQKKPGMESVMLTEPTGNYALRTLERYDTNDAMRNLSGKRLTDTYSRYSIISSSPVQDGQFGRAFKLFIPSTVVYGNPSAKCGIVPINITRGTNINIRTFDQKYGDPNRSMFKNNLAVIPSMESIREIGRYEPAPANPSPNDADALRKSLLDKIAAGDFLEGYEDDIRDLIIYMLWEMERRGI